MYADSISDAMKKAISETKRRREIQIKYNNEHNITPKTIVKAIRDVISNTDTEGLPKNEKLSKKEKIKMIENLEKEMREAAKNLDFERAMELRDIIFELKSE